MKAFFLKHFNLFHFIGIFLGIIGGYAYYHFVGCSTGTCALKSNPYIMISYGAAIGYVVLDLVWSFYQKKKDKKD